MKIEFCARTSTNAHSFKKDLRLTSNGPAHPRREAARERRGGVGCSRMLCRPFVPHSWARGDATKPGKRAQRLIDRPAVWKQLSNIWVEKHHICTLRISGGRDAPHRIRKVILRAHRVGIGGRLFRLSRFHISASRGPWPVSR